MKTTIMIAVGLFLAAGCGGPDCMYARGGGCADVVPTGVTQNDTDAGATDAGVDAGVDAGQAAPTGFAIWGCATDATHTGHVCAVLNAIQCAADGGGQGGYQGGPECNTFPQQGVNADGSVDNGTEQTALYYWTTTCDPNQDATSQCEAQIPFCPVSQVSRNSTCPASYLADGGIP